MINDPLSQTEKKRLLDFVRTNKEKIKKYQKGLMDVGSRFPDVEYDVSFLRSPKSIIDLYDIIEILLKEPSEEYETTVDNKIRSRYKDLLIDLASTDMELEYARKVISVMDKKHD